ncbi:Protein tilB [Borealophlyctis nickersoniae]|nr:Protein tilB [Borealophlyctis nickersoniae]
MVQRIDQDLLHKRAEHNDGELSTLKEVTLHQFDIEKIENLDVYCRHLEILFLQNNQISKIENLNKLKELKYLQLALNNISVIENLEGCEALEKLDLTVNFVEDPLDVETLQGNVMLRELFLVGNPCAQKDGYRDFVITALPQLKMLDGREIEKSERILAAQVYPEIRERYLKEREERRRSAEVARGEGDVGNAAPAAETDGGVGLYTASNSAGGLAGDGKPADVVRSEEDEMEEKRRRFQTEPVAHTPQARLEAARDLAALKEGKKPVPTPDTASKPKPVLFAPDGRVLQKNEGKWPFSFTNTAHTIILDVDISKFLDTSLIDVDVQPTYVRVTIKGKILQLVLEEEVRTDELICERSRVTGHLAVTMLKASSGSSKVGEVRQADRRAADKKKLAEKAVTEGSAQRNRRYERLFEPNEAVDIHNIVGEKQVGKKDTNGKAKGIVDTKYLKKDVGEMEDFEDDPSVPPLC